MARRPTIKDIARRAGVSESAVSFALNGRPGVSEQTRARIRRGGGERGGPPHTAAPAPTGARARARGRGRGPPPGRRPGRSRCKKRP
ncbi:LacI family DNA-binding transcriptional regulator, partial [Streptomyces lavendulae]|uniref:LacI family DNA-binding transcriptional regulator n=1 Tax=Streptomyces lavendulae TaxID=1914 RepID=UPI0036B7A7E5